MRRDHWSLIVVVILVAIAPGCRLRDQLGKTSSSGTGANSDNLAEARKGHVAKLVVRGAAPQSFTNNPPPLGVTQVEYPSGSLKLKGWVSNDPGGGKKYPAVVFLHGGYAFDQDDWQATQSVESSGFVLFMPMLRGENGNPGQFEAFYGEVDDAIAAGRHVASLPYVDSNTVYVAGHSVGAILTSLVAMMPSPYKAAAAFDGHVDMRQWAKYSERNKIPFDANSTEIRLRNPQDFAASLQCPLRLYATEEGMAVNSKLAEKAIDAGKDCKTISVKGDHYTMVRTALPQAVAWFRQLSGP